MLTLFTHELVADVVYATLAVVSNVNDKILNDSNAFCELSAYLEASIEKLVVSVNGVVCAITSIVNDLMEEIDIVTLKWVIEAVVAVAGNLTNCVSSILEHTIEVASERADNIDTSPSLTDLSSALSGISETLTTKVTESETEDLSGIISAADFQATLRGATHVVSSLVNGLALTDITGVVKGLASSISGALGGLSIGITGALSGTLKTVGGVAGGVLSSLNGITGGSSSKVVSQLTERVSGVVNILSDVTLSIGQVVTVVLSVVGNISTVSNSLIGILGTLGKIGNAGSSCFKILPCRC